MAARGLAGMWGQRTESDGARQVARAALPQSVASRIFYQDKRSSADISTMTPEEWDQSYNTTGLVDQARVLHQLRALENYRQINN